MTEPDTQPQRRRQSSGTPSAGRMHISNASASSHHLLDGSPDGTPDGRGQGGSGSEFDGSLTDEELGSDEETGLSEVERKRRRRRRGRSTRLDERVVSENEVKEVEDKMAKATLIQHTAINVCLIGLWYSFSISISVYNKWMFSKSKQKGKGLDFHYPLFTTSIHMIVQFVLASAVLYFFPRFRPRRPEYNGGYTQLNGNVAETRSEERPLMTRWFYLTRLGPCGTATALDIGLGNFSLRFISLTFYTMCKSSVLGFVLLFAFLFRLENPTWKLCAIILVMTTGVVMMVAGETAFNAAGFILVMSASACSGFRWSLTQILLLRNPATSNPFSSIFFLTPVMFLALFVLALPIEGPANIINGLRVLAAAKGVFQGTLLMLFPGCLAFMMVAAEFALLKRTSVVTLSVCGIFKEVLTISAAGIIFGDELSPINVSGLVVTIFSIAAYNYLKYIKMSEKAHKEAHEVLNDSESVPLRDSSDQQREDGDDGDRRTDGLMRDSLGLSTEANACHPQPEAGRGSASRSPVKGPENIVTK